LAPRQYRQGELIAEALLAVLLVTVVALAEEIIFRG
jgi:membrane protease YdiL (CAAX protease family)